MTLLKGGSLLLMINSEMPVGISLILDPEMTPNGVLGLVVLKWLKTMPGVGQQCAVYTEDIIISQAEEWVE